MTTIWKFPVNPSKEAQVITAPGAGRLLHLDSTSTGLLHLWMIIDPEAPMQKTSYAVIGTGWPIPYRAKHISSCVDEDKFVWHLFGWGDAEQ